MSTRSTIWCNGWAHLYHDVADGWVYLELGSATYNWARIPVWRRGD